MAAAMMEVEAAPWRHPMSVMFKRSSLAAVVLTFALPWFATAQGTDPCAGRHSDRPSHCEVREIPVPASGDLLSVDASPNGGISVRGWSRQERHARAIVVTQADSAEEAASLATQIQVLTDGGRVRVHGPANQEGRGWSVSFEVSVPAQSSLDLHAVNGGISVSGVSGRIDVETTNGGVKLARVGGRVHGTTTNGGVTVELSGTTWDGDGLDVETHNGGVNLLIPDNYSAHLEAGTTNGGLSVNIPVTIQGEVSRTISTDLGSGGPTIRVKTVNGGVKISGR
jgi:hypothetical protein